MPARSFTKQIELVSSQSYKYQEILIVEDNSQSSKHRTESGLAKEATGVLVGIHRINSQGVLETIAQKHTVTANSAFALNLIDSYQSNAAEKPIIVSSTKYGCSLSFLQGLHQRKLNFCVKIRPSTTLSTTNGKREKAILIVESIKEQKTIEITTPFDSKVIKYSIRETKNISLDGKNYRLFMAQHDGISDISKGAIFAISSLSDYDLKELIYNICWINWIRSFLKQKKYREVSIANRRSQTKSSRSLELTLRANITTARQQEAYLPDREIQHPNLRGVIQSKYKNLNIVELFAGAGGMGLGFLMSNNYNNPYKLICSGEVHPIYTQTLRQNHEAIKRTYYADESGYVPEHVEPLDLRKNSAYKSIENCANTKGGVQILIGGPPCQGFSSSNRNSGDEFNPHNRLVDVFMDYVEGINPPIALMENVQGIVWAKNYDSRHESLIDYFSNRMKKAGYLVFKRLLDAAWYGVPQLRYRFFAILIHQDLGYREEDFDSEWGAFPFPTHGGQREKYVTVEQAISDLPIIGNGCSLNSMSYKNIANIDNPFLQLMRQTADPEIITDHITSRHADYVIERYKNIPPGENWQSIKDKMSNYANLDRTHSNIYRRLTWSDPSVTIGHYRKSMLIHPEQHRGLSLREAARLQSFPDWFKFAGTTDGRPGGLMHQQQQVANAVCPLLTKAIAEFILKL